MRSATSAVICLSGAATLALAAASLGQTLSVTGGVAKPGDVARVEVGVDAGVKGVAYALVVLQFIGTPADAPPVAFAGGSGYGVVPSGAAFVVTTSTMGQVELTVSGDKAGDGPGVLFSVPVAISGQARTGHSYVVLVVRATLRDVFGNEIRATPLSGVVTVALRGDLDGDGLLDPADATLALQFAVGNR